MPAVADPGRNRLRVHPAGFVMTLWGRLAIAMVLLVVATACALSLFAHYYLDYLAGGAIAAVLALVFAAGIARSLSRPLTQMTRAVEGLSRGEPVPIPSDGCREIAGLAAALAELATQLGTKQDLLEKTVESIRDSVVVAERK